MSRESRPDSAATPRTFARVLLPVWLVTAAWDFVCASALGALAYQTPVARLWRGVASTLLGPPALEGGGGAFAVGVALHLAVAFTWSALFVAAVLLSPPLRRTIETKRGALAVAVAYGPLIWLAMSLVVIPLATGRPPRFGFRWWVQVVAHVPFVTLPLVFMARRVLRGGAKSEVAREAASAA